MNSNTMIEYYARLRIYYIITSWRVRSYIKNTRSSLSMRVRKFLSNIIYRIQSLLQFSNDYLIRGIRDLCFIISHITYDRNIIDDNESFGCYSNFYDEDSDNSYKEESDNEDEEDEDSNEEEDSNNSCASFDCIDFSDSEYSTNDSTNDSTNEEDREDLESTNTSNVSNKVSIDEPQSTTITNKKRKFSQVYI